MWGTVQSWDCIEKTSGVCHWRVLLQMAPSRAEASFVANSSRTIKKAAVVEPEYGQERRLRGALNRGGTANTGLGINLSKHPGTETNDSNQTKWDNPWIVVDPSRNSIRSVIIMQLHPEIWLTLEMKTRKKGQLLGMQKQPRHIHSLNPYFYVGCFG